MHGETSSQSGQRNDDSMHAVLEIQVHRCVNGLGWIQWLGIARSSNSDS